MNKAFEFELVIISTIIVIIIIIVATSHTMSHYYKNTEQIKKDRFQEKVKWEVIHSAVVLVASDGNKLETTWEMRQRYSGRSLGERLHVALLCKC